jgi:hypothetical protein
MLNPHSIAALQWRNMTALRRCDTTPSHSYDVKELHNYNDVTVKWPAIAAAEHCGIATARWCAIETLKRRGVIMPRHRSGGMVCHRNGATSRQRDIEVP